MGSSGSMRAEIGSLIIATSGVQLANGFFNTLISLRWRSRVSRRPWPVSSPAVISPASRWPRCAADRFERVGHIRAYAAFAGMVVTATATRRGEPPRLTAAATLPYGELARHPSRSSSAR